MNRNSFSQKKTKKNRKSWRQTAIIFLLFLIAGAVLSRLFLYQVVRGDFYGGLAEKQQNMLQKLVPQRGEIFVQDKFKKQSGINDAAGSVDELLSKQDNIKGLIENYSLAATSKTFQMLYLVPREIDQEKAEEIAEQLSLILEEPKEKEKIIKKIKKIDDPYEPVANKLDDSKAQKIEDLKFKGVYLSPEEWRFYPGDSLLSHVLGFVGFVEDRRAGQYGLEGYYQQELEGEPGLLQAVKDAVGRWVLANDYTLEPAKNGSDLVLTIDQNIQFMAEKELREVMEKWGAEEGTAIVMDPQTGKILAMGSLPSFNPNEYSKVEDINAFVNPAIQKLYEPGSVFKPITMAAGIDSGKIEPETTYTDTGYLQIGGYNISNAAKKSYGFSTMTQVLEKSINTGAVFTQRKTGQDVFADYVRKFGVGEPTGVDLYGETGGNINNLRSGSPEINFATASFGQGVAVTPLGLITALGVIANQGRLMKPYIVDKIIQPDGGQVEAQPEVKREVISVTAARKVTSMLVSTVENGYDKIKLKDYLVAGKTGTAEIPSFDGPGYSGEFIHTFIGWAPAFDPKFIILLKIDKPKGIRFASDSLSGPFSNLAKYLLDYYEIPPEK